MFVLCNDQAKYRKIEKLCARKEFFGKLAPVADSVKLFFFAYEDFFRFCWQAFVFATYRKKHLFDCKMT